MNELAADIKNTAAPLCPPTSQRAARPGLGWDESIPELPRRAQPTEHILRTPVRPALGKLDKQILDHGRDDIPRTQGVNTDAVPTPFAGEILR